ncbi:hypothetical protein XENTR_v10024898 [Xenopus tropicalis]|nr:hypothetical protein XENTR_v10024898 [Xenopus tropicalis]
MGLGAGPQRGAGHGLPLTPQLEQQEPPTGTRAAGGPLGRGCSIGGCTRPYIAVCSECERAPGVLHLFTKDSHGMCTKVAISLPSVGSGNKCALQSCPAVATMA